jgi:hypothetical protein
MLVLLCREAYKATDIRNKQVTTGLHLAMSQLRQLLQDVSIADPMQSRADAVISEGLGGPGQCLDLSTHDAWASASPLVRALSCQQLPKDPDVIRVVRLHIPCVSILSADRCNRHFRHAAGASWLLEQRFFPEVAFLRCLERALLKGEHVCAGTSNSLNTPWHRPSGC